LVDNAVKFSPHGGDIEVSATVTDEFLSLRVKDSGIGIPEEELQHVFAPFYRATNVGVLGGMGLGLSILHGRLTRVGGRLELSSTEGEGTEMTAFLPRSIFEH
jgi:signal transduction histidine kinase